MKPKAMNPEPESFIMKLSYKIQVPDLTTKKKKRKKI